MSITLMLSMISLSLAMSISPGPVNMLIISSSVNNGFKKTFSFVSGATIGFTLLLSFIGVGFITFLPQYTLFLQVLFIIGTLFVIYLGYKIATAPVSIEIENNKKNILKFYEGFLLQWLNPKAWIASVAGISLYSTTQEILYSFILIYFIICYLSLSFWAVVGSKATFLLNTPEKLKIFNLLMGSVLIAVAFYLFFENI
jgi:threonine/homoserine/homoserine lactone efflux protein